MKVEELLPRLDGVRRYQLGWIARCPAHHDRHPSLTVKDGDKGILIKCWTDCTLIEIARVLGLGVWEFFYETPPKGPLLTMQRRQRESGRRRREAPRRREGCLVDVRREAEYFITSLLDMDTFRWSPAN